MIFYGSPPLPAGEAGSLRKSTVPITAGAKKALRVSKRKKVYNDRRRRAMRAVVKETRKLAEGQKASEAEALLPKAYKAIDKAVKRGVIKKNTAARKKSRLTAAVRKASQ